MINNNVITIETSINSQTIKIKSEEIKSQRIPYFFTVNKSVNSAK